MKISAFDPALAPEDDLARVHAIAAACHSEANQIEPYRSLEDTIAFLRHPPSFEPRRFWCAELDGELVGFGQLSLLSDSPVAEMSIQVRSDARRRGVGHALLSVLARAAVAAGRDRLLGQHATPAGAQFASAIGAVDTRRDVRSVLVLEDAKLDSPLVDGFRLLSWNDRAPDRLVESYARAREAINDAPVADRSEWHAWDAEKVRDLERVVRRRNRQTRVTVALDPAGEVVALTELRVSLAAGSVASTEDTAVVAAYRGRGLARWVKAEALTRLKTDRPDVRLVATTNAETNEAMRSVNRGLGFVTAAIQTTCVLAPESALTTLLRVPHAGYSPD